MLFDLKFNFAKGGRILRQPAALPPRLTNLRYRKKSFILRFGEPITGPPFSRQIFMAVSFPLLFTTWSETAFSDKINSSALPSCKC